VDAAGRDIPGKGHAASPAFPYDKGLRRKYFSLSIRPEARFLSIFARFAAHIVFLSDFLSNPPAAKDLKNIFSDKRFQMNRDAVRYKRHLVFLKIRLKGIVVKFPVDKG
jgi:hypothetical protein